MDPFQTCELLLTHVRSSNLNYSLNESPFSVSLSIRKSFIKDKNGVEQVPSGFFLQNGRHIVDEKETLGLVHDEKTFKYLVSQHEHEKEALENENHNLRSELTKMVSEKNKIKIAKAATEKELVKKKSEIASKEEEVNDLIFENETLSESLDRAKSDIKIVTKDKIKAEKETSRIETELMKLKQSVLTSPKFFQTDPNATSSVPTNTSTSPEVLPSATSNSSPINVTSCPKNSIEISSSISKQPDLVAKKTENIIEDEDTFYNIETNNNFELLAKTKDPSETRDVLTKGEQSDEFKLPKINHDNYKEYFEAFLRNFKEPGSDSPKYKLVAMNLIENDYNMFHVLKRDIKKYNPNLSGFMAAHNKNLKSEITQIIQDFCTDLDVGIFSHGLYFNLSSQ